MGHFHIYTLLFLNQIPSEKVCFQSRLLLTLSQPPVTDCQPAVKAAASSKRCEKIARQAPSLCSAAPVRFSEYQNCFDSPLGLELSGNIVLAGRQLPPPSHTSGKVQRLLLPLVSKNNMSFIHILHLSPIHKKQRKHNSICTLYSEHHTTKTEPLQ